jgi:hypothetical protein
MIIPDKNELRRAPAKASRGQADADATHERKLLPAVGRLDSDEIRRNVAAIEGDARSELSGEHVVEIRQRIRAGAYNTFEVADQVARRLLNSGDLDLSDE